MDLDVGEAAGSTQQQQQPATSSGALLESEALEKALSDALGGEPVSARPKQAKERRVEGGAHNYNSYVEKGKKKKDKGSPRKGVKKVGRKSKKPKVLGEKCFPWTPPTKSASWPHQLTSPPKWSIWYTLFLNLSVSVKVVLAYFAFTWDEWRHSKGNPSLLSHPRRCRQGNALDQGHTIKQRQWLSVKAFHQTVPNREAEMHMPQQQQKQDQWEFKS